MATETTATGKWTVPGVPHQGWHCVDIDDVGDALETCQMCESRKVRFVHVMEHPTYPDRLRTGQICAGHMEQSLQAAQAREREARNYAARRSRWLTRTWQVSGNGNEYIKADGFHVVVYPRGSGWAASITHRESEYKAFTVPPPAKTPDAAKLNALDVLLELKELRPWEGR